MIYRKLSNIGIQIISNNEINNKQVSILSDSKEHDKLDKINSNLKKINNTISHKPKKQKSKLELKTFDTNMTRFKEFLNQSKVFKRNDVLQSLYMIKVEAGTVDDNKLFFLTQFTELIFSNGLTFKDLDIDNDYYDYGPLEANFVWFDIDNIIETKDGGDYKIYEADVIFTLKDKTKKSLKYEFYDNTIVEFDKWYNDFQFIDYERDAEPYPYFESYKPKGKYRIILNDLFQYLDFIGKNFYNKTFIKWNFLKYNYESLLVDNYGGYENLSWQIDKKNFAYTLNLYYKEYNGFELKEKIFKVIKYLDKLIEKNYGMAYIVKAMLYIDGKIILKDYEEAKILLKKAYNLGVYSPSILIWNVNSLHTKEILK